MYAAYEPVRIPESEEVYHTGWVPSLPDLRDYPPEAKEVQSIIKGVRFGSSGGRALSAPSSVDWRSICSKIENQGALGSCTAHAAVGMVEYLQRRGTGKYVDGSRLFVYKTTRNLMRVQGDTGAYIRSAMGALDLFGAPPEKYWTYTDVKPPCPTGVRTFDEEPTAFVYSLGQDFEAVTYFRHDPTAPAVSPTNVLNSVKKYLAAGFPAMFGFVGYDSFGYGDIPGGVPFPCPNEKPQWGHAILAVGYDDNKKITNKLCPKVKTKGALLFRNSWGTSWGEKGYGWIPYEYVLRGLAWDFWTCLKTDWVDIKNFGF